MSQALTSPIGNVVFDEERIPIPGVARRTLLAVLEAQQGRGGLFLPVLMIAGVVIYFSLSAEPSGWIGPTAALAAAAGLAAGWRWAVGRATAASMLAIAVGFASAQVATRRALPLDDLPHTAMVVQGTVLAIDFLPEGGRRLTLESVIIEGAGGGALARRLRLRLRVNDQAPLSVGDRVRVRAMARSPSPPAYPGAWDIQRDAYFAGLGGYGYALTRVETLAHDPPSGLTRWVQAARETVSARVLAVLPGSEGGIAATLLTGGTTAIPEADRAAFRNSGLAHLLAVAGLHIGIVMGLVLAMVRNGLALSERAALFWPCKQIATIAALLAGFFYLEMTGMHVPILRSFAMACLFTLGVLAGRRALSLRGLALAAAAIVLIEPWEVMSVSFQMSFSAVLALIAGYAALRPALHGLYGTGGWERRLLLYGVGLVLTSLLAGTASAPFAAYHFGRVQLYFILANLIAVPLAAMWVMPLGLLAMGLMPFGLERGALVPMGWGIDALLWVARHVAALPASVIAVPHMPAWGLGSVALGMVLIGLLRGWPRVVGLPVLIVGVLSPLLSVPPDILVSADARLVAVRSEHGLFAFTAGAPDSFTLEAWTQFWASAPPRDLPTNEAACGPDECLLRPRNEGPAALLLRSGAPGEHCADAVLLIAREPLQDRCGGETVRYIDRFTVWRQGAQAVWLLPDGTVRVVSDHDVRGDRPWVPLPHPARRLPSGA